MSAASGAGRCPVCGGRPIVWPRQRMLDACEAWADTHGSPPSAWHWRASTHLHPSESMVRRVFGSWNAMVTEAGFVARKPGAPADTKWTRELVIERVFQFRVRYGRLPRWRDWKHADSVEWPSSWRVQRLFGSFAMAIVAAGYEPEYSRRTKRQLRAHAAAVTKNVNSLSNGDGRTSLDGLRASAAEGGNRTNE